MELTAAEAWARILERARDRLPKHDFRVCFEQTEPLSVSDESLTVATRDGFQAEWIEGRYGQLLGEVTERALGRRLAITFRPIQPESGEEVGLVPGLGAGEVAPILSPAPAPPSSFRVPAVAAGPAAAGPSSGPPAPRSVSAPLNERYSFDRFVVGPNNQLSAAACRAVAEAPGRIYNPLFIYGGVGLGKTHLMHAIGNTIVLRDASRRVAYITSERFTNELISSIQEGRTADFRRRYRDVHLLLIDDIHFLGEKERTQEEFFHTFNALHDAQRQIVLTSDRPPKEIPGLEERLVSRFEWGLVTDIEPPDLETRVAIVRKKADDDQIVLADEVLEFIARNCRSNVRELEGAIIKLLAYSSLTRREITIELAREALGAVLSGAGALAELTPASIRDRIAREWGVSVEALTSSKRTKELTVPRQIAMYLIRELLDLPLTEIGRFFGGRDHSTVIHSINRVDEALATDDAFRARLDALRTEFTG